MAARWHQSSWLLCLFRIFLSRAAGQSACSPSARASDLAACLKGIREVMVDTDYFWFGSDYLKRCPPETQHTIDCYTRLSLSKAESVASCLYWEGTFDANKIDRYLDIVYTSEKGSYIGCSHNFTQEETLILPPIDPLSSDTISAWDARGMPALTWDTEQNKQYTLIVQTVCVGIVHGIYINIPGNDLLKATALSEYHGPHNSRTYPYIYAFMVYEQENIDMELPDFELPPVDMSRGVFNESDFKLAHKLKAMKKENLLFLRSSDTAVPLPAFIQVSITNQPLDVTYCCKTTSYKLKTTYLDPFENRILPNAEVRTGSEIMVNITYNKRHPNITADFLDVYLTILCVNPEPLKRTIGTRTRPLLHWLRIDAQVGDDGTLLNGKDMLPYAGPKSPEYGKPHGYYFLVFRQQNELSFVNLSDYAEKCPGDEPRFLRVNFVLVDQSMLFPAPHLV